MFMIFGMKTYARFKEMHKKVCMSTSRNKQKLDRDDKCNKLKFKCATQVEFEKDMMNTWINEIFGFRFIYMLFI